MAGDDAALLVNEDRVGEAKLPNAGGDLCHLRVGVHARVPRVWDEPRHVPPLDPISGPQLPRGSHPTPIRQFRNAEDLTPGRSRPPRRQTFDPPPRGGLRAHRSLASECLRTFAGCEAAGDFQPINRRLLGPSRACVLRLAQSTIGRHAGGIRHAYAALRTSSTTDGAQHVVRPARRRASSAAGAPCGSLMLREA